MKSLDTPERVAPPKSKKLIGNGMTADLSFPKTIHRLLYPQYLRGKPSGATYYLLTLPAQIFCVCLPSGGNGYY